MYKVEICLYLRNRILQIRARSGVTENNRLPQGAPCGPLKAGSFWYFRTNAQNNNLPFRIHKSLLSHESARPFGWRVFNGEFLVAVQSSCISERFKDPAVNLQT